MKRLQILLQLLLIFACTNSFAQSREYSKLIASKVLNTLMHDSVVLKVRAASHQTYDQDVLLKGIKGVWEKTADKTYFDYIQKSIDFYLNDDGSTKTYKANNFDNDNLMNGSSLLFLYRVTGKEKYWKAATLLRKQLRKQAIANEGGFWHEKVYANKRWLDTWYMAEPFYADYALLTHDDSSFNDIANQFIRMDNLAGNKAIGFLLHNINESKETQTAKKENGSLPDSRAGALGCYAVALVDVLENFPANHPKRQALVAILNRVVVAVEKLQDKKTGLWYDIPDKPLTKGNYFDASAGSMFVYAVAKGVRLGVIPQNKIKIATKGYARLIKEFIKTENGQANLYATVKVSGTDSKPYGDSIIDNYFKGSVIVNDPKGMGAFIMAANEMEILPTLKIGKGKTILLDGYFNHETVKDVTGTTIQTHYVWNELDNGGYSLLGNIFNRYGVKTKLLTESVTADHLKGVDIYFIIDPDWPKENPNPNYILPENITAISDWVKAGGVLMLFSNDSGNVEFKHYNELAERFGIHFDEHHSRNMVKGNDYPSGTISVPANNMIFKTANNIYIKEISTLTLKSPAKAVLTDKGDNIIAVSKVGKGTVFAIGDPWVYNEYLDGRKLPKELENFKTAEDLVQWLIKQTRH